ncbi:hypothetical protein ABZ892_03435 [Streptomyces sp. NPDC046924]|uniref:hypothetical protein n=1 Tax=Streptomyces sp. NPDC046924 TaxID=3155136 RepID=UPI0034001914
MTDKELEAVMDGIQQAEAVREELGVALAGVGITLPSLALDVPTVAACHAVPLIDLGRCNLETARRLAAVLRAAGTAR